MRSELAWTLAAGLIPFSSARLNKPVITPRFPGGGLGGLQQGLLDNLSPTHSNYDTWGDDYLPQDCKNLAIREGYDPSVIEAFNIYYDDCPNNSWVFCRHKNGPLSQIDMIDIWGRLPVRSRSYVRHILSLPGTPSAYNLADNVVLFGHLDITHYIHETGHSLDGHAFDARYGRPFHDSSVWIDNYNLDSAVVDAYAQGSQQENIAQVAVVSIFDKVVPGGVGTVQPNWNAVFHQYATFQGYIGDTIIPGGTCTQRLVNSPPVPKSGNTNSRVMSFDQPELKGGVTEIEPNPMPDTVIVTEFDEAGNAVDSHVEDV